MSGEGQSQQGSRQSGPDGKRTGRPEEKETVSAPLKERSVDEGRPSLCNTVMTALRRGGIIVWAELESICSKSCI